MIVTIGAFLSAFPEYEERDEAAISFALGIAEQVTPKARWGDMQRQGIMLHTAHQLDMRIAQDVQMASMGASLEADVPASGLSMQGDSALLLTTHGTFYKELRDRLSPIYATGFCV